MSSDKHDASYYAKCMVGGIFACGLTHAAICPLDIVKCRKQVNWILLLINFLGQPNDVQEHRRWFQSHQRYWRLQRFHPCKFLRFFWNLFKAKVTWSPQSGALPIWIFKLIFLTRFFRVGSQLWSDMVLKVSASSVSTKFSRMFSRQLLARKTLLNTKLSVSLFPQHVLNSSLISHFLPSKQ